MTAESGQGDLLVGECDELNATESSTKLVLPIQLDVWIKSQHDVGEFGLDETHVIIVQLENLNQLVKTVVTVRMCAHYRFPT